MIKLAKHITFCMVFVMSGCTHEIVFPEYNYSDAKLKVKAAEGLTAGNTLSFYVATKEKAKSELLLIIDNGIVPRTFECINNSPIAIPEDAFTLSGLYTIKIAYQDQIIASRKLNIKAGEIVDPLEIYTGPNTIVVGGKQASMITAIPADQHDNAITYEAAIKFESDKAKGIKTIRPITNLYSALEFESEDQSKKILVGVSKNAISSTEQVVNEISDWPTDYSIEVINQYPYADNRQYTKLRTSRIYDSYGNQIADGTLVIFEIQDSNRLVGSYKAITIDGVANVFIKNPSIPTEWKIRSYIGDYSISDELQLSYKQNLQELLYEYDSFQKTIKVGPLRSVLGQYIPDGTLVTISSKGVTHQQETYNGYTTFKLVELDITHKEQIELSCALLSENIQLQ